jgi:PAT family beta-lactamase induction signal transducer AmpG
MAVSRYITGAPTGYLVVAAGWVWFFIICTALAIPGLLLLIRYHKWAGGVEAQS